MSVKNSRAPIDDSAGDIGGYVFVDGKLMTRSEEQRRRALGMYGLIQDLDREALLAQLSKLVIGPGDLRPLPEYPTLAPGSGEPAPELRKVSHNLLRVAVERPADGDWGSFSWANLYQFSDLFFDDAEVTSPLRDAFWTSPFVVNGNPSIEIQTHDERGFRKPVAWILLDVIDAVTRLPPQKAHGLLCTIFNDDAQADAFLLQVAKGRLVMIVGERSAA